MTEVQPRDLREYLTEDGNSPFSEWLDGLDDILCRAAIRVRLDRVAMGNLGDYRSVGDGVQELRIDCGPGYRVYIGQDEMTLVILLCGGSKRTQEKDIEEAKLYWEDYKRRIR